MIRAGYTSSVSLVVLGESLDPAAVSSVLKLDSHDSWSRGQPKRVGHDLHAWGGWKRHLPPDRKSLSLEVQLETGSESCFPGCPSWERSRRPAIAVF